MFNNTDNKILNAYYELLDKFSIKNSQWEKWCKKNKTDQEKFEIIIEAILTQRTNWQNVEKAINNLKNANILTIKKFFEILKIDKRKIINLIKPAGFKDQKAEYLYNLFNYIFEKYSGELSRMEKENYLNLRQELLKIRGVGPETADSILLYAFSKPVFVVDEYTRRFCLKYKITQEKNYYKIQKIFEENLPKDYLVYQNFHALIVIAGKAHYFKI